jgi:hypothetical protein
MDELQMMQNTLKKIERNINDIRLTLLDVSELIANKGPVEKYILISGCSTLVNDSSAQLYYQFSRLIDRFHKELVFLIQKRIKLSIRIMYYEMALEDIDFAIKMLEPIEKEICEKCYGLKSVSNLKLSHILHTDEKTIRNKKKAINFKIACSLIKQRKI